MCCAQCCKNISVFWSVNLKYGTQGRIATFEDTKGFGNYLLRTRLSIKRIFQARALPRPSLTPSDSSAVSGFNPKMRSITRIPEYTWLARLKVERTE
jgi:hypothetical protein